MLIGRHAGLSLRPMIEGHVSIPSIGAGGFIQFLIDTGADCTTITPSDGKRLRIDYNRLTNEDHSMGYTGSTLDFVCDGIITFSEIGIVEYEYDIELRITKLDPNNAELFLLPSLLGRDVLNQWYLSLDPKAKKITADVLSCS